MAPELQPVILAAGEGSKMYPLTENLPKCLLPVGNVPMISYCINYLQKYGFQDFTIIVRQHFQKRMMSVLHSLYNTDITHFELVALEDDKDIGIAEALEMLKGKITTDLLIVSCDTMTSAPLHRLADLYRTYDASLCVMMSKRVEVQSQLDNAPGKNKKKIVDPYAGIRDFVSIDEKEGRLLYFANEGDLEQDHINIKKSLLKRYPHMKLQCDLVDSHIYIIKQWLLNYLIDNKVQFESLKSDFVPHVVRKQFSKHNKSTVNKKTLIEGEYCDDTAIKDLNGNKDIFSYQSTDELIGYSAVFSGYQGNCLKDPIKCYAYVTDEFCLRINTLPNYAHVNREIKKLKDLLAPKLVHPVLPPQWKSKVGPDCLVGESTSLGNDNVTVKKSMIGSHCNIASNVRISNSVIMDHVTISEGCTIQGSIVCDGAHILNNSAITNCRVAANQTVAENSDLKNETVVQEEMEFDADEDED